MTIAEPPTEQPSTSDRPYHPLDISAGTFWDSDFRSRDETFAQLRAEPGLTWHPPSSAIFPHEETGYWALTRHADIRHASLTNDVFVSGLGITVDPMPAEIQRTMSFFLAMDAPEHTRYRRLIAMSFTPRQIKRIEDQIRANARTIVDDLLADLRANGSVDFAADFSGRLPMRTISEMIGIAPENHEVVAHAVECLFSTGDDEYASLEDRATHSMTQLGLLMNAGIELAQLRRVEPHEDLMTGIVEAEVDGHRLTDTEVGAFMVLIGSAGNDTTKQTSSHALKALIDHPEQRDWLLADFDNRIDTAIDEFVRWSTPVLNFARHASVDTEIAGTPIAAGEKVALFYCSGNRDESVFDRPHEFDISRSPNPHVGFGGGGAHFCLGAQLARMELRHLFRELLTRLPEVEIGEPEYLHSNFVHGIKRMRLTVR
ncbi:cytochrome P450 [Rhodococcus sp. NPDC003348]